MTVSRRHTLALVLLLGVVILAYSASLRNGFVWDDNFQIVRNPYVHTGQPLTKVLFSDVWGYLRAGQAGVSNYYRPLQTLVYRWAFDVAGLRPGAFHLLSILFHCLACIAAYGVFFQLTQRFSVALAAAVIFAVHPMHSEAVLWIAALSELGCALFYFLAFWFFLRAQPLPPGGRKMKPKEMHRQTVRRRWMLAAACASFFLALLWKEMALTLPVIVMTYVALMTPQEHWPARLREAGERSLPFWGVTAAYVALRVAVLGYFSACRTRGY